MLPAVKAALGSADIQSASPTYIRAGSRRLLTGSIRATCSKSATSWQTRAISDEWGKGFYRFHHQPLMGQYITRADTDFLNFKRY